jgi:pimeloyl-ACP methyl ester carboxylesterase
MEMQAKRLLAAVALSCAAGMAPSAFAARSHAVIDDPAYEHAQQLVPVEGSRRLNLYCTGHGTPTVVFDAGLGDGTKAWGLVQPVIARRTRACSYDRAGLGFSDPAQRPGTSANAVDDLHRLLVAAGIKPPYVMVGHSLGGMNTKLYAETYPAEVLGLVLVDPSHEDLGKQLWKIDPAYQAQYAPYIASLQPCLTATAEQLAAGSPLTDTCVGAAGARYSQAINATEAELGRQPARRKAWISEQENIWFASAEQLRAAYRDLGDIPLIVLTKEPVAPVAGETQALRDAKNRIWIDLHDAIARMSSRGTRWTIADTGHYIQLDQPGSVDEAIFDVLRVASTADDRDR